MTPLPNGSTTHKRALIVGAGTVGFLFHLPRIERIFGAQKIDLVEVDARRIELLAEELKTRPSCEVHREIPDGTFYDLAVIATPPKFHYDGYRRVAPTSSLILIEKPIAIGVDEAERIERDAKDNGRKVLVNLLRRTLGAYRLLRELHREGRFGALKKVFVAEGGVFSWEAASIGSFSRELSGGGFLMDTGPHTLDLLFQVFDELTLEEAWMDAAAPAIEANATLKMRAEGNVPITLLLSRNRRLSNEAIFEFEEAVCVTSIRGNYIEVKPVRSSAYWIYPANRNNDRMPTFSDLFDDFYRKFVVGGSEAGPGPSESIKALRIIEAAYGVAKPMGGGF